MVASDIIDVDVIWKELGTWGRFQVRHIIVYGFICVSWCLPFLSIVFIGNRPHHECRPVDNQTTWNETGVRREYGQCSVKVFTNTSEGIRMTEESCPNGWSYGDPVEQSFTSEWDLVCDRAGMAELTQSLFMVGLMLGSMVFPPISDRYGRKFILTFSHVALLITNLAAVFTSSYTGYAATRIATGIVIPGLLASSTLMLESFPTEARGYTEVFGLLFWASGIVIMAPLAYLLRNVSWKYLQLSFAVLGSWSLIQWWLIDESIRWLILNNHLDRAKEVIKKACKTNNKSYNVVMERCGFTKYEQSLKTSKNATVSPEKKDGNFALSDVLNEGLIDNNKNSDQVDSPMLTEGTIEPSGQKMTVLDIFRHKEILKVSLILWWMWISDSLIYFGLYMISSELAGNRYINFLLSAAFEYPVVLVQYFGLYRLGRKRLCMMAHVFGGTGLVIATILTTRAFGNRGMMLTATAFTLLGKMGMTSAMSALFVYTPELYPTNLRNSAYGIASFMGKIGTIVCPYFRILAEKHLWAPAAIFAVMVCINLVMLTFLPETSGVELPQTMSELRVWYSTNSQGGFFKRRSKKADKEVPVPV